MKPIPCFKTYVTRRLRMWNRKKEETNRQKKKRSEKNQQQKRKIRKKETVETKIKTNKTKANAGAAYTLFRPGHCINIEIVHNTVTKQFAYSKETQSNLFSHSSPELCQRFWSSPIPYLTNTITTQFGGSNPTQCFNSKHCSLLSVLFSPGVKKQDFFYLGKKLHLV